MRRAVTGAVTLFLALEMSSCAAPSESKPRLYDDDGEPIVGKIETRYGTVELTAEGLDARTASGFELREMRAQDVMADVDPDAVTR